MTAYQPHQQRVVDEKSELDEKIVKLFSFKTSVAGVKSVFQTLPLEDQDLMHDQLRAMLTYSEILGRRIARFAASTEACQ